MKKHVKRYLGSIMLGIAMATIGVAGQAQAVLFSETSGTLSASANFSINGSGQLVVVLTNTSTFDVLVPTDVLTAVFFSTDGTTFTPLSALLSGGSTVFFDVPPAGGNVGGEWAYAAVAGLPGGATQGISSSGFGVFGDSNFNGLDLDPPTGLNGLNYGITSAGDLSATGNAAVTGNAPLIQNQVTFTLSGATGFDLSKIDNVSFQYGTALTEPNVRVPEPASALLLGSGLVAVGLWRRFRKAA